MLKICVLGSGSKGNSIYINCDGRQLLIDCGFTKKETAKRLSQIGKEISDIECVFVTHDHGDHSAPWIEGLRASHTAGRPFIKSFPLSHDGAGSVGYAVEDMDGNKVAVLMDTGCVPEEAIGMMFDCAVVMIECNYDVDMLAVGKYPTELLERIASSIGHLRNECAAEVVEMVAWQGLKYVFCLHLSTSNNHPDLVKFCMNSVVDSGVEVIVAQQKAVGRLITVM